MTPTIEERAKFLADELGLNHSGEIFLFQHFRQAERAAVEAEREECAKIMESREHCFDDLPETSRGYRRAAMLIRARGEKP